jgi:hypothetical protein
VSTRGWTLPETTTETRGGHRPQPVPGSGGTTIFGADADACGIVVLGLGPRVLNNDVSTTVKQGTGTARGISIVLCLDGLVVNNRITEADGGIHYAVGSISRPRCTG